MKFTTILVALLLTGCGLPKPTVARDQCLRQEIFFACLKFVPQGPKSTVMNDWDEVISECESTAYYQAIRPISSIKAECMLKL